MSDLEQLMEQVGRHFSLDAGPCHGLIAQKIELLNLDDVLTSAITGSWPRIADGMLGPYRFRSAPQLLNYEQLEVFLPDGEVPIGDAACGDLLILSVDEPYSVSLFCHEFIWGDVLERIEAHAPVSRSFHEFLLAALRDDNLPSDYYGAKSLGE